MNRFRNTRQPDWGWWGELWGDSAETLGRLGFTPGESIADVGCGNGFFTLPAAELVGDAPVYAIDIDEGLLSELSEHAEERGLSNVTPIHGDARDLASVLPEPVDVVLIANTFHGVEDRTGFVEEAFDSLRPDGRLVVANWRALPKSETTVAGKARGPPEELRLSAGETREIVATTFEEVEEIDLPPYHYAMVGTR